MRSAVLAAALVWTAGRPGAQSVEHDAMAVDCVLNGGSWAACVPDEGWKVVFVGMAGGGGADGLGGDGYPAGLPEGVGGSRGC